jgi:hypothetical protein
VGAGSLQLSSGLSVIVRDVHAVSGFQANVLRLLLPLAGERTLHCASRKTACDRCVCSGRNTARLYVAYRLLRYSFVVRAQRVSDR